jgi:Mn-dependent DtxR family transcriptional regulator
MTTEAPREVTAEDVLKFIKRKPGLTSEEIARSMNAHPKFVKAGLAKLRRAGTVLTSGVTRAMAYTAA